MQKEAPTNRLRELRLQRELRLYDISAVVRRDPATVHRWETGGSQVPDDVKLELAHLYDVTVDHLMGWDLDDRKAA